MTGRKLFWQLFPSYLLILVLSLAATVWYASTLVSNFHLENIRSDLEAESYLIRKLVSPHISDNSDYGQIDGLVKEVSANIDARITVILPDGTVIADSARDPLEMEGHSNRPEIKAAFLGETGMSTRYSNTIRETMMYVAIPLERDNSVKAVVRTSVKLASVSETLGSVNTEILTGVLAVGIVAILVSVVVSRKMSRPLEELRRGAENFAAGELDRRLPALGSTEVKGLAEAMNKMAAQLNERITAITRQRNEEQAILSSMSEGVIAVDTDERIIRVNQTAAEILQIDAQEVNHRTIQETIRNTALQNFISDALTKSEPVETEIMLQDVEEKFINLNAALMQESGGKVTGVVVVLNDITNIRKLEKIRREFVANVSHELKTPVTSIKGFVETLQDGALKVPRDAERFLGIISRELDRLNSIIEDLLLLSRVEQDAEKFQIEMVDSEVGRIINKAVEASSSIADEKHIKIKTGDVGKITVKGNALLLEHAIVNLIDNAVKHSPENSEIEIESGRSEGEATISVIDHGAGIDSKHHSRIFERFYRVDKGRSRKQGGTGLGLAIVKHIVQAHGGRIAVESSPGEGSRFTIHLPESGK